MQLILCPLVLVFTARRSYHSARQSPKLGERWSVLPKLKAHSVGAWRCAAKILRRSICRESCPQSFKEKNLKKIIQAPVNAVRKICPSQERKVFLIMVKYERLFLRYRDCRKLYGGIAPVDDDHLATMSFAIKSFMEAVRATVVDNKQGNITPKLHLLEDHVLSTMKRTRCGMSLLGEQGGEAIHHAFNELNVQHNALTKPTERLLAVLRAHLLTTLPKAASLRPKIKERRRNEAEDDSD